MRTRKNALRLPALALALCLLFGLLAGCGNGRKEDPEGKIRIVATVFPLYDWVKNVLGEENDRAEATLLLGRGADLHSFQPSAADILKIASADLFFFVGGESDEWVRDALEGGTLSGGNVLDLTGVLKDDLREEELVEGMEEEEEGEEEGPAYDEHLWLSLRLAEKAVDAIAEKLGEIDPAGKELYRENAEIYIEKLARLDREYEEAVQSADVKTVVFADRFPFRYLADDYGLTYFAAFPGCSAETEASFQTVVFLAGKLDELELPAVLTIETGDGKIAATVVENTEKKTAEILVMDSMQSSGLDEAEKGESYLGAMEKNLAVLKKALNR